MKDNIAFDIETEGFAGADDDEVTVAGFFEPTEEATLFLNTQGKQVDIEKVEERVANESGEAVTVIGCLEEEHLFDAVEEFVTDFDIDDERLVAFNGETWSGGFDIPFLRTRCLRNRHSWVFNEVAYMDISKVIERRFNTTIIDIDLDNINKTPLKEFAEEIGADDLITSSDTKAKIIETIENHGYTESELEKWVRNHPRINFNDSFSVSENGLDEAYTALFPNGDCQYDPFDDSEKAVEAYLNEEWVPLLLHNLADIRQTYELIEISLEYALKDSENKFKNNIEEKVL